MGISNIGDMSDFTETSAKIFSIKESYVIISSRKNATYRLFFNGILTMNNCLFWTISYPRHLIKTEVVEFIANRFKSIIEMN